MVVSGLPVRNGPNHAREISRMSLSILQEVKTNFIIKHKPDTALNVRIGLHTGKKKQCAHLKHSLQRDFLANELHNALCEAVSTTINPTPVGGTHFPPPANKSTLLLKMMIQ